MKHATLVMLTLLVGCDPSGSSAISSANSVTTSTTVETADTAPVLTTVTTSETNHTTVTTSTTVETADTAPPEPVDADGDGFYAGDDCDDDDSTVYPGAKEVCDGVDNDCSGAADEEWDEDGDGTAGCAGDCDDADPYLSPNIPEICDGVDNDCDGEIDEGFDADGDGQLTCRGDCDDEDPSVYMGAPELCDGVDTDCDPSTSDDADLDGDGYTLCDGDCNDNSAAAYPGATEICDGVDNDCNGATDEFPGCFACTNIDGNSYCQATVFWEQAEDACVAFGGHLASISDASENSTMSDTASSLWNTTWWIGYNDIASEGVFEWSDGTKSAYESWYTGEPNDSGGEDCVATGYGAVRRWNDLPCSTELPFICEGL